MSSTAEAVVRAKELGMQAGEYIKSWYGSLPLFTSLVLVSSLVIQIVNFISFYNLPGCLSGEVYFASPFLRLYLLLSNPFLHRGWLHLIFNSIAFAPLGGSLEKSLGSLRFLHLLLLFSVLISVVYLTLTFFVGFIVKSLWSACVEGLSGLIFAYISAESSKGEIGSIDVFGIAVPFAAWPWILLIVGQLLFGGSFFGHVSGILIGLLYARSMLEPFIPAATVFHSLEESRFFSWATRFPTYIGSPGVISLPGSYFEPGGSAPTAPPEGATFAGFVSRLRDAVAPSKAGYAPLDAEESLLASQSGPSGV